MHEAPPVSLARQLAYLWQRHVLRRRIMLADGLPLDMRLHFYAADDVGRHLFKYRRYEGHLLDYLAALPAPGPGELAFDIGANLGWYPVLLHRLWAGRAELHAFEPDPRNRRLLEDNLALNSVSDVRVVAAALSDRPGQAQLNRYRALNLGKHSLLPLAGAVDAVSTPVTTLDAYVLEQGLEGRPVALLKVDVEGLEPAVIAGARRTLEHTRLVLLEYSPMYYRRPEAAAMLDQLQASGFGLLRHDASGWTPAPAADLLRLEHQVDTLWLRSQRAAASSPGSAADSHKPTRNQISDEV